MKKDAIYFILLLSCIIFSRTIYAQYPVFRGCPATVDFSKNLKEWDGFGFNYVETAQTIDYIKDAKDYGGFSIIGEKGREDIISMVFGEEGLKVGLVKMFLDPFHQYAPGGIFDHETSTKNMRMFVKMGLEKTRSRGSDLQIITTLYGPPSFVTLQRVLRGRDLDPEMKNDLALYMIDWAKFLIEKENFPVKYISLNNEGEDWERWPVDGKGGNIGKGHDYNMYWPTEQVNDFLKLMPPMIKKAGLKDLKVTNGEPTNWYRFSFWGYANALYEDKKALNNLGLITSHGFFGGTYDNRWYGSHTSTGIDLLHTKRPELHAWVTSTSWSNMDSRFIKELWGNIYEAKVNGIIPWAGIQRPPLWVGGDPNPGCAFKVSEDGSFEVTKGYYFYKQVCRAGQPGMAVAYASSMDSELPVIAFSSNKTKNPDVFVVTNTNMGSEKPILIKCKGTVSLKFRAFRTSNQENYTTVGDFLVSGGEIFYVAPANSVTTFYAIP
jgi:hypothetical protein